MRVVADTGPLVAAANRRDRAHVIAAALVIELGRDLVIPEPVLVEVDHLVRRHVGAAVARSLLASIVSAAFGVHFSSPGLLRRAVEIDAQYADLDLGYADATVMALAERENLPVLTFDFEHFRATRPEGGFWRLLVDEHQYAEATAR